MNESKQKKASEESKYQHYIHYVFRERERAYHNNGLGPFICVPHLHLLKALTSYTYSIHVRPPWLDDPSYLHNQWPTKRWILCVYWLHLNYLSLSLSSNKKSNSCRTLAKTFSYLLSTYLRCIHYLGVFQFWAEYFNIIFKI